MTAYRERMKAGEYDARKDAKRVVEQKRATEKAVGDALLKPKRGRKRK